MLGLRRSALFLAQAIALSGLTRNYAAKEITDARPIYDFDPPLPRRGYYGRRYSWRTVTKTERARRNRLKKISEASRRRNRKDW